MSPKKPLLLLAFSSLSIACATSSGKSGQAGSQTGTDGASASDADPCALTADDYAICTEPGGTNELTKCFEYRYDPLVMSAYGIEEIEDNCVRDGGTFNPSGQCPDSSDLVGSCVIDVTWRNDSEMAVFFYADNDRLAAQAELTCDYLATAFQSTEYNDGTYTNDATWCPE